VGYGFIAGKKNPQEKWAGYLFNVSKLEFRRIIEKCIPFVVGLSTTLASYGDTRPNRLIRFGISPNCRKYYIKPRRFINYFHKLIWLLL